jgi:hypothetical protein
MAARPSTRSAASRLPSVSLRFPRVGDAESPAFIPARVMRALIHLP